MISDLIKHITRVNETNHIDLKIAIEILMLFTRLVINDEQKQVALYSIIIPVLVKSVDEVDNLYLHEKLIVLVRQSASSFKQVVNKYLDDNQKKLTEEIVTSSVAKNTVANQSVDSFDQVPEIQLKTFGV